MTHPPAERSAGLDVLSRYTLRGDAPAEVKLQHAALAADALADTAPELSARRGRRRPAARCSPPSWPPESVGSRSCSRCPPPSCSLP